jgi:hypothetical protein
MPVLIEELKKEHLEIAAAFNEVNELGITSKEGRDKLLSAKSAILTHLRKEDEQLFPLLRKEAENNKGLKKILDLYAINLERIKIYAQKFFNEYSEKKSNIMFMGEYAALFADLNTRMKNEEKFLFEEYEKIKQ